MDLSPDFQRNAGIWNLKQKSRLIESLLLRISLPGFYVASDREENWAVVDGLRCRGPIAHAPLLPHWIQAVNPSRL